MLAMYRSTELLTVEKIAERMNTTFHNVSHVLRNCLPRAEYKALASLRYSASKMGSKNPMTGKTEASHHHWIGVIKDGYGYLTCLKDGKRQFVHRIIMATALGLQELPEIFDVHHIDGNTERNELDNLALTTRAGHKTIHFLQVKDSAALLLKKSTLAECIKSMTSP